MNENKGKDIITNEKKEVDTSSKKKGNEEFRKKLIKIVMIVAIAIIVLLLIIFIVNMIKGTNMSYDKMEQEMKKAAIEYYKVQDVLLPQEEGEKVEVDATTLASEEYKLMKPLAKLNKKVSCTGKVVVEKVNGEFIYTPYLDCGNSYATKELYKAVLEQGTVTSSSGLYQMNGEYVYRGEDVNNYIQLTNGLFRIIKVTSDNKLLVMPVAEKYMNYNWDDRYNPDKLYNSGFNNYRVSRVYDYLGDLYKNGTTDFPFLSKSDKEKLTTFSLCIGKRNEEEVNNTNQVECSDRLEGVMVGLLTASDYLNASLDANCKVTTDMACQNYNYLKDERNDWWLITAVNANSYEVFYVNRSGYINEANASSLKRIKPVVMINNNVMIKSGTGTLDDPYILK